MAKHAERTIIRIEDLVFEYARDGEPGPSRAIDGVSLDIQAGSFTAVIGRNGSGKSTLARNINALLLPCGGAVYVDGFKTSDAASIWEIRQRAGMVFQNPDNQLVSAIVEDDVAFGPENLGIAPDEIRRRVDAALGAVDMYGERKKSPHMLSGGQKQRVAIAGVVAMRPKCIIFDEPTAMLDPQGRAEVMKILGELHDEGITLVLITHFMEETVGADRIVIMDAGRVALDGPPAEVFRHVGEIRAMGLDAPLAVELGERLRKRGHYIPYGLVTVEEMVAYLCR
ncbi:MAG: energy-coupling factor transporter ATPase [Clostridiales Family XIII bacterium]|jgi:energy-coupling factor transport system ATP-binding protein|nr:energy-coupling factor transporter ATPase [Clostridiales Family XIII bacterium]